MKNLFLAKEYLNQNKVKDAISILQTMLKAGVYDHEIFFELGKAYFYANDFVNAILNFKKSIEIKKSFWAQLLLAKSLRNIGKYRDSIKIFFRIKKSQIKIDENIDKEIVATLILLKKYLCSYKYINKYSVNDVLLKKDVIYNLLNLLLSNTYNFTRDNDFMIKFESFIYEFLKFNNVNKEDIENQMLQLYTRDLLLEKDKFCKYIISKKDDKEKLKHYNYILNEIEIKRKDIKLLSKPQSLTVTLNNICNIKCIFCDVQKSKKWQLSDNKLKEIIDLMPYLNTINWLGGEVFLYKNFNKLFEIAKYYNVYQEIVTNGLLLDKNLINMFMQSKMKLSISITSVSKELYEYLHNGAQFDTLLKNLNIIRNNLTNRDKNFFLCMYVCVMKENFNELEEIVNFAYKYHFDGIRFQPLSQLNDYFYNKREVKDSIIKALMKAKKYNIKINNILPINLLESKLTKQNKIKKKKDNIEKHIYNDSSNLFCINPWQTLIMTRSGRILFDCSCPKNNCIDNINNKTLLDVWNSQNVQMFRKKIKEQNVSDICSKNCIIYNVQAREEWQY